jgi:hypothetical protein
MPERTHNLSTAASALSTYSSWLASAVQPVAKNVRLLDMDLCQADRDKHICLAAQRRRLANRSRTSPATNVDMPRATSARPAVALAHGYRASQAIARAVLHRCIWPGALAHLLNPVIACASASSRWAKAAAARALSASSLSACCQAADALRQVKGKCTSFALLVGGFLPEVRQLTGWPGLCWNGHVSDCESSGQGRTFNTCLPVTIPLETINCLVLTSRRETAPRSVHERSPF